jgi:hypothetical protein
MIRAITTTMTLLAVLLCAGCPEKEKAAKAKAEAAGGSASDHAPVVRPVENKLDNAMQKNEDRAKPDPD